MGFWSIFTKENKSKDLDNKFTVSISSNVLEDVKSLLMKQNKTAVRIIVSGFC